MGKEQKDLLTERKNKKKNIESEWLSTTKAISNEL